MVIMLQLINYIGNGFDVEDKPLPRQLKKFEDRISRGSFESNAREELAESL